MRPLHADDAATLMKTYRVVLMSMRPRLRDILTDALARELDVDLIDWRAGSDDELAATQPDVMVCEGDDPLDAGLPTRLLQAIPKARVIVVAESGDRAAVFELRPTRTVMRTVGIDQVISAIRYGLAGVHAGFIAEPRGQRPS